MRRPSPFRIAQRLVNPIASPLSFPQRVGGGGGGVGPVVTVAPTISNQTGGAWEGSILAVDPGEATGASGPPTFQWKCGGVPISGATSQTWRRDEASLIAQGVITCDVTWPGDGVSTTVSAPSLPKTTSGIVAFLAFRATQPAGAGTFTDTARSVPVLATSTALPAGGLANATPASPSGLPTGAASRGEGAGYRWKEISASATDQNSGGVPSHLAGMHSLSSGAPSSGIAVEVPAITPLVVQISASINGAANTEVIGLRDGDSFASNGAPLSGSPITGAFTATTTVGIDGTDTTYANWLANTAKRTVTFADVNNDGTGFFSVFRGSTGAVHIRAIRIVYPEYDVNYTLATAYSDIVNGSDTMGDGTTGAPFKHPTGWPDAAGVVPAFIVTSTNILRSGTYRPANFATHGPRLIPTNSPGASGAPVSISADSGADVIIDGSVLLTSWGAVTSTDTGGAWENPNHANLQKYTGVVLAGAQTRLVDGEDWMNPAQWPSPANPADIDMTYLGGDSFYRITAADFATKVANDLTVCGPDGNAGSGYHKITIRSDSGTGNFKDHYVTDNISAVGYDAVLRNNANHLIRCRIITHDISNGIIICLAPIPSGLSVTDPSTTPFQANGVNDFLVAVRGHPYDIAKAGQYGYTQAGVPVGHFKTATRGRIANEITAGWSPNQDHVTLYGSAGAITVRRIRPTIAALTAETARVGQTVNGVRFSQIDSPDWVAQLAISGSSGQLTNVTIDTSIVRGVSLGPAWDIDGLKLRDLDGTAVFATTPATTGGLIRNLDICDMAGIHANGIAAYLQASDYTFEQGIILNVGIPLSTAAEDFTGAARNLTFRNMLVMGRLGFAGNPSQTVYTWQMLGGGETGLLAEGLCLPDGVVSYGSSSGSITPSTGGVIRNCVFGALTGTDFTGLTLQNTLVCLKGGLGVSSIAEFVSKGGADGGGNVFLSAAWAGGLTADMQKALTITGPGTYAARNIGQEATAFDGAGKALLVPAFGAAFTLTDTWISTDTIRKEFRLGLHFGALGSPEPDVTYTLPAGQGDNALFALDANYVRLVGDPSGAATRTLVVDKTTTDPNVSGGATKRTSINISLI